MTQSAITSALNGKVDNYTSNAYLYGINIDNNGAYIYNNNNGNIYFRYKNSAGTYLYTNIESLQNLASSFYSHGLLISGANLNDVTEYGTYQLASTYTNSPFQYGTLSVFGGGSYMSQFAVSSANEVYSRFRNEKNEWTKWNQIVRDGCALDDNGTKFTERDSEAYLDFGNSHGFVGRIVKSSTNKFGLYDVTDGCWMIYANKGENTYVYLPSMIISDGIYNNTSTGSANLYISERHIIKRFSSASKYKLDIQNINEDEYYPYKLLNISPKQWFDRSNVERWSDYLTKEATGTLDKDKDYMLEEINLNPYYGLIAEDLEAAGLDKFCTYGAENKDGTKELEGVQYDRIMILAIPILRDLVSCMQTIIPEIKSRITDKDTLTALVNLEKRFMSFNKSNIINNNYGVDITEK